MIGLYRSMTQLPWGISQQKSVSGTSIAVHEQHIMKEGIKKLHVTEGLGTSIKW